MTLRKFTLEGTDGVNATAANTGLNTVNSAGAASVVFKTAAAFQGSTGLRFTSDGSNAAIGYANLTTSATQAAFSFAAKIPASAPAADYVFAGVYDTASARVVQFTYKANGSICTTDKGNVQITVLTAAQATAGSFFRFELVITALSATAGAFTARAYNAAGSQVGSTANATTANTGTTALQLIRLGCLSATAFVIDIDSVQVNDGATSEIGPLTSNTNPPTVTAGANQTISATGSAVNLTCTATADPSSAGISSYQWTLVSGITSTGGTATPAVNSATSQTANFTPTAKGRYIFSVTATDAEGNTSAPVTTRVFVPDTAFVPIEVTSNSGWTAAIASVQDATDSTYVESGAPGSGSVLVLRLSPMVQATSGFDLDVRNMVQSAGGSQKVALLEGATVRKDWGAISPGTAFADQHLTLTTAEMATVGSWNELDLQFTQV